jgi:hypothetical protein
MTYADHLARALPEQRRIVETITDDNGDEGDLIPRGQLPPAFREPSNASAVSHAFEPIE